MAFFARPQTTAVKIASPSIQAETPPKLPTTPRKDSTVRQCRNVMIYGFCKYENKGCLFSHPSSAEPSSPNPSSTAASPTPETRTSAISAEAVNAPVFVPKGSFTSSTGTASATTSPQLGEASTATPTPPPDTESPDVLPSNGHDYPHPDRYYLPNSDGQADLVQRMEQLNANYYDDSQYQYHPHAEEFYPTQPVYDRQPLDYHLYSPAPPTAFVISGLNSHFVPPSTELRQTLQKRSETIHGVAPMGTNLPAELQGYHTLVSLDNYGATLERRKLGNWYTTVYRAIRSSDNMPYALRRVEGYRLVNQSAFMAIDIWSRIQHPSIVPVVEAFTTRAFQDSSVVFVHSYYSDAQTLYDAHLRPNPAVPVYTGRFSRPQPQANVPALIPERTISSYIVQIATAIKKVHSAGLAVRMIEPTKILLTGQNRIRISSCGIIEVLLHDTPQDMALLQQEDLTAFGRLLLILCCNNPMAFANQNYLKSLEFVHRNYGLEMKTLIVFLTTKAGPLRGIDQVLEMIRNKLIIETDDALLGMDRLESELLGELENARLVRLLCKLNFINERPEFSQEPRWSETGDRYIIKLFRDYVFHQVDPNGNAVLNMGFVLTCLNKLDTGTDERIMLISRDQQSCLVVSYKEIKACIAAAIEDLSRGPTGN